MALNWIKPSFDILKFQSPLVTFIRNFERKPWTRRWGYKDTILGPSLLPRSEKFGPIKPLPEYRPRNSWNQKRALFGQNDYIDILGSGHVHPSQLLSHVPRWLRGYAGNEYGVLTKRLKAMDHFYKEMKPEKYDKMLKRSGYLYKYLNRKTWSQR